MAPFKKILSSEIARLVYGKTILISKLGVHFFLIIGYLNDCGVDEQLSCQFLHQSPYLTECRELHDEGDAFNTDFKGLSLKEILQEYSFIHHTGLWIDFVICCILLACLQLIRKLRRCIRWRG